MSTSERSKLAESLENCTVPEGSMALAWLGQAGFVLKSPGGITIALDPHLSNSGERVGTNVGGDTKRRLPPPLLPHELKACHAIAFTHSHEDHVDPDTVKAYLQSGAKGIIIAPHEAADRLRSLGVDKSRILLTWPNHTLEVGDFVLKATLAIPFAGDDLTHVGYLIEVHGGPRVYFTGETDYNKILATSVGLYEPDVMVTVISSAVRNLSPGDAARLAQSIRPRWAIPRHHDLFADNTLMDRSPKAKCSLHGMTDAFRPLQHGDIRIVDRRRDRGFRFPRPALASPNASHQKNKKLIFQ